MREQRYDNSITRSKSKVFALRIIKFVRLLQDDERGRVISKQLLRSGTSIGANVRESYNAQSKADFINKLHIALKEADETAYWLELLYESDIINKQYFDSLYGELKEIIALLTASIKTLKNNETKK
ncbi:MAG: four helix bundle protein [Alistipes sp.]|nr:four helix bundle protein [Alistipes sp.]MBQ5922795.1 four helix bundle protein [Alistipes sp.]